ncbi:class I SAM-dependent methyltransferase [Halorubellus sp. PRR65]|uniref:class I SAM-dependent methyltransferase n=1 Tax=Halorubellus sp. PRR65 TaxID=3098148 RepID=UPI002B2619AD|nr:class I SAM-dependent methyltransferase [Halorubellus sp. PRR65]
MNRNDVRRAWDAVAETYAESRDPTGNDADLVEELREYLPDDPVVLDVGCGDGARTLANLPADAIGVDVSRRALELASETVPAARLLQGDMTNLPLVDDSVDAITAYHAVFHVARDDHPEVYREFARVLKPGGYLLMTLPTGRFETVREDWMGGRMFFSAPGERATVDQLEAAGFGDVHRVTADDPLGTKSLFAFATLDE